MELNIFNKSAEKLKHPCFDESSHIKHGRIHLPVSPTCNIGCNFCSRTFNQSEERPGVTRRVLNPQEALELLERGLKLCPDITVVGIAGPGDPLASNHAIETFNLVHKKYPELINCVSTNGLNLPANAEKLKIAGVKTLTVTVNSVNPETQNKINSFIIYNGKKLEGVESAEILIKNQLEGLKIARNLGFEIKVNTVLIPGVNEHEIEVTAKTVKEAGAGRINIIPVIPQHKFKDVAVPNCIQIEKARQDAEKNIEVFRHCKHCRADACGIPGTGVDFAETLYDQRLDTFSHG